MVDVKDMGGKRMTEDEILKIKEHIEIHARREPKAIKITEIMWKAVDELEQIAELEKDVKLLGERCNQLLADKGKLTDENTELKVRIGLSIECEKAQKNGELCLGYAGDEDEPCEQCKNCIKCECGYYQLGETEKDEQLTKAKTVLNNFLNACEDYEISEARAEAEQFLKEIKEK